MENILEEIDETRKGDCWTKIIKENPKKIWYFF